MAPGRPERNSSNTSLIEGWRIETPPDVIAKAQLCVAENAVDADELIEFLHMLGIDKKVENVIAIQE